MDETGDIPTRHLQIWKKLTGQRNKICVAILLFDDVEVLDFAGPYEVLSASADEGGESYAQVVTVSQYATIRCRGGLRVLSDCTFGELPAVDVLIVPGGPGARAEPKDQDAVVRFIREYSARSRIVASVCTGAFLMARAGLLAGRRATTHSSRLEEFATKFPDTCVIPKTVVDEGHIITSAGVASGIDLALHLLAKLFGREARDREARRLGGPWGSESIHSQRC
jgi:transcriptional regulator GlxA family with amidase domain